MPALRNAGSILTHQLQTMHHLAPPGCPSTVTTFGMASPSCIQQTFPATTYSLPAAAPITGLVGYSLSGMNIYNPLEAGFSSTVGPSICSTSGYYCSVRLQNLFRACPRQLLTSLGVHVHFSGWSRPGHLHCRADLHLRRRLCRRHHTCGLHLWRQVQGPRQPLPLPCRHGVRVLA